jgi:hypothetical protein
LLAVLFSISVLSAAWIGFSGSEKLFELNSENLESIELQFILDGFEQTEIDYTDKIYTRINHPEQDLMAGQGMPELPSFSRLLAIPDWGEVSFEIIETNSVVYNEIDVYPHQNPDQSQTFFVDEKIYSNSGLYPQNLIKVEDPAVMRDIRLINLTISPFQFDAQNRSLRVSNEVLVRISTNTSKAGTNPKITNFKLSRAFDPIYRSAILNYEDMMNSRDDEFQNPCYLFIYPNVTGVIDNLQYLADWKKQMGYDVHVVSTSTAGTTTTAIKNYIQNAYDTWQNPPEFVCFIGDANGAIAVPTYYESGGEADHPYSQLAGNDILADVILGRISISTPNELQSYIAKVFNYEKQPFISNTDWFTRALLVGDPGSSGPSTIYTNQFVKELIHYSNPAFQFEEYYGGNYSGGMVSGLNMGVSYFNYRGYIGMSGFGLSNINALNNGFMLPFAVFLTCDTGSFASTYSVARSEAFIRAGTPTSPKGAIAAIGTATSSTHTTFNNAVTSGTFYGIFADGINNPGGAVVRGKLHLYNCFPGNPNNWVNNFSNWNTLMGDPGIKLWTDVPQTMMADYQNNINIGENFLEVTVTTSNGNAIENAWVCAIHADDIFERAYTDQFGKAFLPINATNTGSVTLTITAHNFIPHLGSFDVINSDVFVNVESIIIDDDVSGTSNGNGDGVINPGETIELKVGLKNFGTLMAENVTAQISCDSDFVMITDADETFGNISSGNVNFSADDFDFTIAPDVLGGSDFRLDLVIEDNNGNSWNDHIFLVVEGANLYVQSYIVDDNNGILDPSDTAEIILTLFNFGSVTIIDLDAMLSCSNDFITMEDSLATFPNILPGQTGTNAADTFTITLDPHAINGMQIPFEVILSNPDGFAQTVSFLIDVGTISTTDPLGPDSYGYYAYDSTDETYDQAPIYNWIEIDPSYGGNGTIINLYDSGDQGDVEDVNLPFSFNFYGVNYNMISVCSNGWIAPGGSVQASFMNSPIPSAQGPSPMIAPFWDDLKMGSGHVYYYYDLMEHAFIVQWSRVQNDFMSSLQNFQVLIYDPAVYPTSSGDAIIVFQYDTVNNNSTGNYSGYPMQHGQYATVGLEDHTFTRGLQYTFNNTYSAAAAPLQNGLAIKFTTEGGGAMSPPVLALNQTSFDFVLSPGSTGSQILEIYNEGEANLIYSIEKSYAGYSDETSKGHGGPDNYGYQWFDSNEPNGPEYNWRDISGLGAEVIFPNSTVATDLMPIGFDFYFYGDYYSEFRINPNGWIGFGDDFNQLVNLSLPHPWAPHPAIMPFWDDLDPVSSGNVYYYSTSDSLIVWFNDVIHTPGNYNGTYDFQVILYTNGDIVMQYRSMIGDTFSSTIGVQNSDYTDALQIVYNNILVQNEYAIIIKKVVDWLQISPTYGYIELGQAAQITLEASAEELIPDQFSCQLIITTNDLNNPIVNIPVNLLILAEFPHLIVSQNELDFGLIQIGEIGEATIELSNIGNVTLNVSDITFSDPAFSCDTTSLQILPEESTNLTVYFQPTSSQLYDAEMIIFSNDYFYPQYEIQLSGEGAGTSNDAILPMITTVFQNYPNPFNPETRISFSLAEAGKVKIIVYNIKGEKVKTLVDNELAVGQHQAVWTGTDENGKKVSSGVYLYKFSAGSKMQTKRMLMIK